MKSRPIIFHLSFAIALVGLLIGTIYHRQYYMVLSLQNTSNCIAVDENRKAYKLPFTIALQDLYAQYYDNDDIKQITAVLHCTYQHQSTLCTTSVNHPAKFLYYQLYIQKYQLSDGHNPGNVQLMIVRQPAQILVYGGLGLFVVCSLWWVVALQIKQLCRKKLWIIALAVVTVTAIILLLNPMMRQVSLPPILRSVWFIPHLIAYILSYAMLTLALAGSLKLWIRPSEVLQQRTAYYLRSGTALFGIGIVLGMIWAKVAWGNFWGWDPKEICALITWILYLGYIHILQKYTPSAKVNFIVQLIAFLSLQMCWYGLRLLQVGGLHVYR